MTKVLVFEDKLGITEGYTSAWERLSRNAGFSPIDFYRFSAWKTPEISRLRLLIKKGNRKSPGFNEDKKVQAKLGSWFTGLILEHRPDAVLVMDVALLGLLESDWGIATIDYLRGGVYWFGSIPILVTVPVSAINTQRKTRDIRATNDGAENQEEWEERNEQEEDRDPEAFFFEPYTIPFGRWVLQQDLQKLARLVKRYGRRKEDSQEVSLVDPR